MRDGNRKERYTILSQDGLLSLSLTEDEIDDIERLIRLGRGEEDIFDNCSKVASIDLEGGYQDRYVRR